MATTARQLAAEGSMPEDANPARHAKVTIRMPGHR
jgi:hypothetical protein